MCCLWILKSINQLRLLGQTPENLLLPVEGKFVPSPELTERRINPSSRRSASLNPHYRQNPYDQFVANTKEKYPNLEVKHARGCLANKWIPLFPDTCVSPVNGQHGMSMDYFGNMTFSGTPVATVHRKSTLLSCYDNLPKSFVPGMRYSYR